MNESVNETEKLEVKMKRRMFRWSLVSTGIIALFWVVFYLVKGYVPVVAETFGSWTTSFSGISRWWDVLIGPLWAITLAYISTFGIKRFGKEKPSVTTVLMFGIMFSIMLGIVDGLSIGVVTGLVFGILGLLLNPLHVILAGHAFSTVIGLTYGIVYGLCFGSILFFVFAFLLNIKNVIRWLRAEN